MRVHFLRHGQSVSNAAPGALPGPEGDNLTELGWEQAREAGRHLGGLGATRILTSPLRRARQTAEAVAESLDLPIVEWAELHELREADGFGELTPEEQRLRRWSVLMSEHADDPDYSHRGGESFHDVLARVRTVQDRLIGEGEDSVLAVSHGIYLRFFLMWSLLGEGFGPAQAQRLWQLRGHNCGLTSFEHSSEPDDYATDSWRLVTWMQRPWDPP